MDNATRIKMIKAMEFICRNLNDEELIYIWLTDGVDDGAITLGDLEVRSEDNENLDYFLEDSEFADLMDTFLYIMKKSHRTGGLYCDGVISHQNGDV